MKRLHIHIAVEQLARSIEFYSALFGAAPTVEKSDYAKWMLDDPHVNFAISSRGAPPGLDHLGIQVEDAAELASLREQFAQADLAATSEGEAVCCYARSDKSWLRDPTGIAWEAYHTMAEAALFNGSPAASPLAVLPTACCGPHSQGAC